MKFWYYTRMIVGGILDKINLIDKFTDTYLALFVLIQCQDNYTCWQHVRFFFIFIFGINFDENSTRWIALRIRYFLVLYKKLNGPAWAFFPSLKSLHIFYKHSQIFTDTFLFLLNYSLMKWGLCSCHVVVVVEKVFLSFFLLWKN